MKRSHSHDHALPHISSSHYPIRSKQIAAHLIALTRPKISPSPFVARLIFAFRRRGFSHPNIHGKFYTYIHVFIRVYQSIK